MDELLVERPRWSSHRPNEEVRAARCALRAARTDEELDAVRRPQGRPKLGIRRALSENLNPLHRFLQSRVGQPWDRVYSELRSQLDMRSPIQLHIMQHLNQYVAVRARREPDGTWLACNDWGWWYPLSARQDLVVDPRSGLLVRVKMRPAPVVHRPDHHRGPDGQVYARYEGLWWAVTVGQLPRWSAPTDVPVDAVLKEKPHSGNMAQRDALYGGQYLYATSRRPLNRRELKALGLWRR